MLRRYGSFVKSIVASKGSKSGKKSSKVGAWADIVVKRSPVSVKWLRISVLCSTR